MNDDLIPDNRHRTWNRVAEALQKLHYGRSPEICVFLQHVIVPTKRFLLWANGNGSDCRDAPMRVCDFIHRGFPTRRESFSDSRIHHEPCLVNEDKKFLSFCRLSNNPRKVISDPG